MRVARVLHPEVTMLKGGLPWLVMITLGAACRGEEQVPEVVTPPPAPIEITGPPLEVRLDEARGWLRQGEVERARGRLERLVLEAPTDAGAWTTLAAARLAAGDLRPALEAAERALALDDRLAEAWVTGGAAMRALGDLDKAKTAMDKALLIDPTLASADWTLAAIHAQAGRLAEEADALERLIARHPDDVQGRFALAKNALRQGGRERARALALEVVERAPTMLEAHKLLAALAWDAGEYRQAFERARIAVRLAPDDAPATRLLEASFYVLAAARMTCELGPRPAGGTWEATRMMPVLAALERDEGLTGAGVFAEIDERFAAEADVRSRVAAIVKELCKK
ncbi:MAG: tetratricopeptide repeat protein [Deltaproteobacteria bacterium]|nr:tetratricopeptide repeat protein [Deltaproteobacteria bacterium]